MAEIATLVLDDSIRQSVSPILCTNMIGASEKKTRATDLVWQANFKKLKLSIQDFAGSSAKRKHVKFIGDARPLPNDGFNMLMSELEALGDDPADVLGGSILKKYGRVFWDDLVGYAPAITSKAGIVMNMSASLIGINDINRWSSAIVVSETDKQMDDLSAREVIGDWIQYDDEGHIDGNKNCYQQPEWYSVISNQLLAINREKYPDSIHSGCTPAADRESGKGWMEANSGIAFDAWGQHFQLDSSLTTLQLNLARVNEFPSFCEKFKTKYPGKGMVLTQSNTINYNPFTRNVGDGVINMMLAMIIVEQNILQKDLLKKWCMGSAERFVKSGNNDREADTYHPLYYFAEIGNGMFREAEKIKATFENIPGSENLFVIAEHKNWENGGAKRVYILNVGEAPVTIDRVTLNGNGKSFKVEQVWGKTLKDEVVQKNSDSDRDVKVESVKCEGQGITKLSFK